MGKIRILKAAILLFWLILMPELMPAQELIFERQPDSLAWRSNSGPNRQHYHHAFITSSLILPVPGESMVPTRQPFTGQLGLGVRYKLRATRTFALVAEAGYLHQVYRISQLSGKNFPDNDLHQSQKTYISGPFGGAFLRIRFGQRGDYLGTYADIGIIAASSLFHYSKTREPAGQVDAQTFLSEKTTVSRLKDINPLGYKAAIRLGFDRVSLVASYRWSRLLKESWMSDLPALEIGLELSPVRY